MLIIFLGNVGTGKTLSTTLYALMYSLNEQTKDNTIYSNYRINLPNTIYSKYLFLPISELMSNKKGCLIIYDDIYALKELSRYIGILANLSRKMNIEVLFTCQYYTMIERQIRFLAHYQIEPYFEKETKLLYWTITPNPENYEAISYLKAFSNALDLVKGLYNTKEIVNFINEKQVKQEILKMSKNKDDIEFNIGLYTRNKSTQKRLLKELTL